jgi:hypothetical protein
VRRRAARAVRRSGARRAGGCGADLPRPRLAQHVHRERRRLLVSHFASLSVALQRLVDQEIE